MERLVVLTERDKKALRLMFKVQAGKCFEKDRFRRRRDAKHSWPRNAEGRTA